MTEVSYGQFFDAFEDFNFPKNDSNPNFNNLQESHSRMRKTFSQQGMLEKMFKVVEHASFPQLQSTDSMASLSGRLSVTNSTNSLQSEVNQSKQFFDAVQSLIIANNASSSSLSSEGDLNDVRSNDATPYHALPFIIAQFLRVYEDFMHNYDK
jgi:hypothetical protein